MVQVCALVALYVSVTLRQFQLKNLIESKIIINNKHDKKTVHELLYICLVDIGQFTCLVDSNSSATHNVT